MLISDQAKDLVKNCVEGGGCTSSETQGQIKGARESLNGRKNLTRRKVKNGEKSPWVSEDVQPPPSTQFFTKSLAWSEISMNFHLAE